MRRLDAPIFYTVFYGPFSAVYVFAKRALLEELHEARVHEHVRVHALELQRAEVPSPVTLVSCF